DQFFWLRRYHEAELMRLGLRDILGLADFEQNLAELSVLADACLQYALEVVMQKNKIKTPPLVIIGLGKLGGCEIDYGSDLDILFVTSAKEKNLPRLQRLAVEVMDLLSKRTEQGMVFHTDARLRPEGEKRKLLETSHVVSYSPDWKTKIHQMRLRIEKERTPRGQDDLAIKTGKG